jgi:hypothetical protein
VHTDANDPRSGVDTTDRHPPELRVAGSLTTKLSVKNALYAPENTGNEGTSPTPMRYPCGAFAVITVVEGV